jgi:hypothetical protein
MMEELHAMGNGQVAWLDVDGENVTNIHSQNTVNSFRIKGRIV